MKAVQENQNAAIVEKKAYAKFEAQPLPDGKGLTQFDVYANLKTIDEKFTDSEIFSVQTAEVLESKTRPEQQAYNDIYGHKESFIPT